MTAEQLATQVSGIDIHPLSVQIAKSTVLLALADIKNQKKPIALNIYLANSLLVPDETADLFRTNFKISIDGKQYTLNILGVRDTEQFDRLINVCDEIVLRYDEVIERDRFIKLSEHALPSSHDKQLPRQLYDVYRAMKRAKDQGRDTIWKFILQNTYKPVFLQKRFDVVVGNPPW